MTIETQPYVRDGALLSPSFGVLCQNYIIFKQTKTKKIKVRETVEKLNSYEILQVERNLSFSMLFDSS